MLRDVTSNYSLNVKKIEYGVSCVCDTPFLFITLLYLSDLRDYNE